MSLFSALGIAGSGVTASRTWMDAVSDNLANLNTATRTDEPGFQQRYVQVEAVDYGSGTGGVRVAGVEFGDSEGRLVYEPGNPLADEQGYVKYPDIDMSTQMGQLIMAQRSYQANLSVVERARTAYEAALSIGRGA